MKRALMVAAVSAALITTQAAASSVVDLNAGDRLGGPSQAASQLTGGNTALWVVLGLAVVAAVALGLSQDHSSSP